MIPVVADGGTSLESDCKLHTITLTSAPPRLSLPVCTMSASMKAYLAGKYMSGPKADAILARTTTKKKKRKAGVSTSTSNSTASGSGAGPSGFIVDDDASWVAPPKDEEEDDLEDAMVVKDRNFKRRKVDPSRETTKSGGDEGGGGWTTIREGITGEGDGTPPPTADELPQIAGVVEDAPAAVSGGLLTKAQLRKRLGPKPSEKEKHSEGAEESARQQETVYRDASGRRIDMKAEKAEAARRKREAEEKETKKMEWGKGLVQREEKERERAMMEKERHKGFSRHADDTDLNEEQKAKELWNDPAAAFVTVRPSLGCLSSLGISHNHTEETEQRPAETGIHGPGTPAEPVRDQTRISVGRSGPEYRIRAEILSTPKRTETPRGRKLCVGCGRHVI